MYLLDYTFLYYLLSDLINLMSLKVFPDFIALFQLTKTIFTSFSSQ